MPFTDLPLATPGPEYPVAPTEPATGPQLFNALQRKRAIGNASAQIDPTKVCSLIGDGTPGSNLITPGANSALITVEAANDSIVAGKALIRFWMDGTWPSVIAGTPTYDGGTYEIQCIDDLNNFRMISTDGNQHVVQIQFFSGI
jgi:hypothetical protein